MNIAIFSSEYPQAACAQLRLLSPLAGADGCKTVWAVERRGDRGFVDETAIESADLIVIQRFFPSAATAALVERIVASGRPVIYEIDDLLTAIPVSNPHHAEMLRIRPYVLDLLGKVDAVTVSTARLASAYAKYCKEVIVLPNLIDGCWYAKREMPTRTPLVVAYAGTPSHRNDLSIVEPALLELADEYGDRIAFKFLGCSTDRLARLPNASVVDFRLPYRDYVQQLQSLDVAIAIAPLEDHEFNRCKSNIKWLEYSLCGIAGVFSNLEPYAESVQDGATGLLVGDCPTAWRNAVEQLIAEPAKRQEIAENARQTVLARHTLQAAGSMYAEAYRKVVERKQAAGRSVGMPSGGHRDGNAMAMQYLRWAEAHQPGDGDAALVNGRVSQWPAQHRLHLIVVLTAREDEVPLADTLDSLGAQTCDRWRLTVIADRPAPSRLFDELEVLRWVRVHQDIRGHVNEVVRAAGEDWVALIEAGDRLASHAVFAVLDHVDAHPEWQIIYSDEDRVAANGVRSNPLFKPDFNLDLLRSTNYVGDFCPVRGTLCALLGGYSILGPGHNYDLVLRVLDHVGPDAVGHVPDVLHHRLAANAAARDSAATAEAECRALVQHLQRSHLAADVSDGLLPGSYFVQYRHADEPLVSVIIPTKDHRALLEACISSLTEKTTYPNYELLIVDNGSTDADAVEYLEQLPARQRNCRVLHFPYEYNFSAMNNFAAREADGDYLLLLNNDTVVVQPNWLERMMALAQRGDVGVVGPRLVYPNQRLQHAGVVLGMGANGVAEHPLLGQPMSEPGYMGRAQLVQNFSAVTGACLLIRRSVYFEVGGLDEECLRVMYNDIDLCLRVGQLGYRIVWTPYATLVHHGSATLDETRRSDTRRAEQGKMEVATMLERWLPRLANDPAYNRNLSLIAKDYSCDVEMGARWHIHGSVRPRVLAMGAGSDGSWEHRVRIPLGRAEREGRAAAAFAPRYQDRVRVPSVTELARERVDILLLHNTVHDIQIEAMRRYRRFNQTFMVYSQDDLMYDLPAANPFHGTVYPDIKRRLRQGMRLCDRLIVTTEPLANAYRTMASDIRIVPNYLDGAMWRGLVSRRGRGRKPRVGWAGAQQHGEDLRLLYEVIQATADEVDWVFFGLCLEEFLPYVSEVHKPVPFAEFPGRLASLDLDLAVAPLARNRFNEAKSNLKILEYGALGVPVVCTDIHPYRDAPVRRVANTPRAWLDAIRERIGDADATADEGRQLQEWVVDHWMLEDHLDDWSTALSPDSPLSRRRVSGAP